VHGLLVKAKSSSLAGESVQFTFALILFLLQKDKGALKLKRSESIQIVV